MIASRSRGHYFTPEEYLKLEASSSIKHEHRYGLVFAVAGAKKAHVTIVGNLSGLLFNHLRNQDNCVSYASDIKVEFLNEGVYYYPDLAVSCDERDLTSNNTFIKHPKLIIEVLSDSTEAFDRGEKFTDYKNITELEEYILVHQRQILVERFWRQSNSLWLAQTYRAGEKVEFSSIEFTCPIEFLYEKAQRFLAPEE